MTNVVDFPTHELEVMACGSCGGTEFNLLADGRVPQCTKCDATISVVLAPLPQWILEKIKE